MQALVSLPPRHAKTFTIQHGLAYLLRYDPANTHAFVTNEANLAHDKSREIQRYALDAGVDPASWTARAQCFCDGSSSRMTSSYRAILALRSGEFHSSDENAVSGYSSVTSGGSSGTE